MARRHHVYASQWDSVARRLDEIISAHSGEDPFEEALKLVVAKLVAEVIEEQGGGSRWPRATGEPARAVAALLERARERWPGVLAPDESMRLAELELARCVEVLAPTRLLADDLVGLDAVFEFIVNKAAKGQKGQYFTPRYVIREVVRMLEPRAYERALDPACGSGGFLREALKVEPRAEIFGFDQDSRAVRVARVMLAASGASADRVTRCDSLGNSPSATTIETLMQEQGPPFAGFDLVLTNPPFAGDVTPGAGHHFELARGARCERDVLFVERCVELLAEGGRFAIILPHNKVGSRQWTFVREWLLARARVVAVLGLGRNTFLPHTSQKACVVIGVKRRRGQGVGLDEEILFGVTEQDGKDSRGQLRAGALPGAIEHDLGELTELVRERFARLYGEG